MILALPLAEIATFIVVGNAIGVLRTLMLIVVSAAVGFIMLRDAGIMTAFRLQRQRGDQAAILAEGGTRMLAGLLLLIPGFLTDLAALLILIPPVRDFLLKAVRLPAAAAPAAAEKPQTRTDVIDGDFRRLDG
ncbi:MAG TPA: FxsA family protein [Alphaproteobacteria bacterium]|nr:FxsA family protein [Alphaproteobacteria bacterium]